VDLANPARAVLPTGTAAVLRVLTGAKSSFTIRELARLAEVSAPVAGDVVHRLADHGLVLIRPAGSALLCRFNDDHLAARAMRDLITLRARMIELLRDEIKGWAIHSAHASLFGSAARGDGGIESDLDLLVVRPDELSESEGSAWDEQLAATGRRALAATGNPANWLDITRVDLALAVEAGEPIVEQWRHDAVDLAGESLASLLRGVA
jgi:predicted nucleotidyltransferase